MTPFKEWMDTSKMIIDSTPVQLEAMLSRKSGLSAITVGQEEEVKVPVNIIDDKISKIEVDIEGLNKV